MGAIKKISELPAITTTVAGGDLVALRDISANKTVKVTVAQLIAGGSGFLTSDLTDAHIFVGDALDTAQEVAMSGDATLANDGTLTLINRVTGATKTKVTYNAKGLVTAGADATTADIASSTNKRYVTDADLVVLANTSNINTGDETTATIKTKLGVATTADPGYLIAADWNTFNGKEDALTISTGLTRTADTITSDIATGKAGGQTITGGTAAGEDLTIRSTSDATKGSIFFGTASEFDEVNNRLGIGVLTPTYSIETIGFIKTGNPITGLAKPFKVGSAASVSPTSPNRTIELELDGTIYYLHAKTTND